MRDVNLEFRGEVWIVDIRIFGSCFRVVVFEVVELVKIGWVESE